MTKVIAVTGHKGSGKDTGVTPLLDNGYELVKFAGGLKTMTHSFLEDQGVDPDTINRMVEGDLKEIETKYLSLTVEGEFERLIPEMTKSLLQYQGVNNSTIDLMLTGSLLDSPSSYLGCRTPRYFMGSLLGMSHIILGEGTPRNFMIRVGTEFGRNTINEHIWTDIWKQKCHMHSFVATTDCRFPNEEKAVRDVWGTIIRVERPGLESDKWQNHPSESYISQMGVDHIVVNDTTISDLQRKISIIAGESY